MENSISLPFYQDWTFWSFVVAGIAVVLSQLPPMRILIRPKRLDVDVLSRVRITHQVGNPNFSIHVCLGNSGGRNLRIRGMKVNISRDGKELLSMPAQNYFESPTDAGSVLFVPFTLKPDEYWSHSVIFLNFFDRATEKQFRENETSLKLNIQNKIRERPENIKDAVVADYELVKPFYELFEKLFVWKPGEYIFELVIDSFPSSTSFRKMYRFTLFESDSRELIEHLKDYQYGGGLVYTIDRHIGLLVPIAVHYG